MDYRGITPTVAEQDRIKAEQEASKVQPVKESKAKKPAKG